MKKTVFGLMIILTFAFVCFAQDGDMQNNKTNVDVATQTQTATEFSAELLNELDTEKTRRNDDFQLRLNENVKIGEKTLDEGTKINGRVVRSRKISKDNDTSLISLYVGSVKEGDEYFRFNASIVSIGQAGSAPSDEMQFSSSNFQGATVISMKGKNMRFEKGTVLRLKIADKPKSAN